MNARRSAQGLALTALTMAVTINGCRSPLHQYETDELRRDIASAITRELATGSGSVEKLTTSRPPSEVERALVERQDELSRIGPASSQSIEPSILGSDLTGAEQSIVNVDLTSTIQTAVKNNLDVRAATLQPAINQLDVIAAEAIFDVVLFGNMDFTKTDQPTTTPVLNGIPLGTGLTASDRWRLETGVRKLFSTGGEVSLSTDLTRFQNNAPGLGLAPDPQYLSAVRLGATQPLLRGFGSEVNRATIRLNQNAQRASVQEFIASLLDVVNGTEAAYWDLVFAWEQLAIQQWLAEVGIEVRNILERRLQFDVRLAEYSDAVARVEQRNANIIEARRAVRVASDRLKLLLNDEQLNVGSEVLLRPIDLPADLPINYSLLESLTLAYEKRPEVQQALLNLDDAAIRIGVRENARLPRLDLNAEMAYFGQDDDAENSYDNLTEGSFVDYIVGLAFEWPFGNRAADAEFSKSRLQRSVAVIQYRNTIQAVTIDVKTALRDVVSSYELIGASRSSRIAQTENLRTLLVEEETQAGLTPEFLNLKFQRQESLADARTREIQALVNHNKSIAQLQSAMGVALERNQIDVDIMHDDATIDAQY